MIVSWVESVLPKNPNGNKVDNGARTAKRFGFVSNDSAGVLTVQCDDNVVRLVDLRNHNEENPVIWHEEEEQNVNPT